MNYQVNCKHLRQDEIYGSEFCIDCGEKTNFVRKTLNQKDIKAFEKAIQDFQGKYNKATEKIPTKLYDFLHETFPNERSKVTKPQLRDTMRQEKRFQRFVKHTHWIHHIFTGVERNFIENYSSKLIDDYKYLLTMFIDLEKIPYDNQLILYVLLNECDCDFNRSEFNFTKTNYSFVKEETLVDLISG